VAATMSGRTSGVVPFSMSRTSACIRAIRSASVLDQLVVEVQEVGGLPTWSGPFMRPIVASALVTNGEWQVTAGRTRPELVGEPRPAVVVGRSGE
jgi:hypothetical protein